MIVSGSNNLSEKVIRMEYQYNKIDYEKTGIYPIKTGEEAWSELEKGGGYVFQGESSTVEVKIRRVFLGYFDAGVERGVCNAGVYFPWRQRLYCLRQCS